jgi:hypothetical protein
MLNAFFFLSIACGAGIFVSQIKKQKDERLVYSRGDAGANNKKGGTYQEG